jgi:hypothetical protein
MNDITVMKFPMYYKKRHVKQINKVNPDILIFDDCFITSVDEFIFPDSIIYLDFGKRFNKSLKNVSLPKYLKKLKFGDKFVQSLDYVKLPDKLEILEFGNNYQVSLFSVKFPDSLQEIILNDSFNHSLPFFLPKKLEKIVLGGYFDYSLNTFIIPENLKYLRVNGSITNKVLFDKLPQGLKSLEVVNNLDFNMNNLPDSIEELIINMLDNNANFPPNMHFKNTNFGCISITEQTNLPFGLTKIKLSHASLVDYIKKIPFDCKLVDMNDQEIVLQDIK